MLKMLNERNVKMIWNANGSEVWFHAGDIGEELNLANIHKVIPNIDKEEKKKFSNPVLTKGYNRNFKTDLNNRGELFISEEAVYNISFRSNKPEAKLFTKWVTTVLKQIRINGYYIATEKDEAWLGVRAEGKQTRHEFTDEIQVFVEYALQQGSRKPEWYYKTFTELVNKKLAIPKGMKRDELPQPILMDIMALERVIAMRLSKLVTADTHYKQVYQEIKELIEAI